MGLLPKKPQNQTNNISVIITHACIKAISVTAIPQASGVSLWQAGNKVNREQCLWITSKLSIKTTVMEVYTRFIFAAQRSPSLPDF